MSKFKAVRLGMLHAPGFSAGSIAMRSTCKYLERSSYYAGGIARGKRGQTIEGPGSHDMIEELELGKGVGARLFRCVVFHRVYQRHIRVAVILQAARSVGQGCASPIWR